MIPKTSLRGKLEFAKVGLSKVIDVLVTKYENPEVKPAIVETIVKYDWVLSLRSFSGIVTANFFQALN
jgi:hypothetical protein